jgi:gamma-glutamyltranspeptidase
VLAGSLSVSPVLSSQSCHSSPWTSTGELLGLAEAHKRWAKLPWSTLVAPAQDFALGFPVGRELGKRLPRFADLMLNNPDWQPIFAPENVLLKEGEILRRENLSRTLDTIGRDGVGAFYNVGATRSCGRIKRRC